MEEKNKIIVFQDKKIRRVWYEKEWYFSVVDVVSVLTESPTPRQYWGKVKSREFKTLELSPIWVQLKLEASDGKQRLELSNQFHQKKQNHSKDGLLKLGMKE